MRAPVSRKIYFPLFSIKIRNAARQLFSSIDCFDVLEQSNECCDPSRIEGEGLLRDKRFEKPT
jgi:hypothetical protein